MDDGRYIYAVHKGRFEGCRGVYTDWGEFLPAIWGGGSVWKKFYSYDRKQAEYYAKHGKIKANTLDYLFEPCDGEA